MNELALHGTIHKIFDEQQISDTFVKREFVIRTDAEKYPQLVKFELYQDKINLLLDKKEGQQVKVSFNVRGREWKDKYFVSLSAWKINLEQDVISPLPEEVNAIPETTIDSGELPF